MSERCADLSRAREEELAGTGIHTTRWLLVESRVPWGRDAVETGFPPAVAERLAATDAKVLAIRRPGRGRAPVTAFAVESGETRTVLRRLELARVDELPADPWAEGEEIGGTLLLVCTHGRRDACCSRLGIPVFHALEAIAGPERVWQCSHTGGHRFAANVIGLPWGVTLGRVEPDEAPEVVGLLVDGRVPLALYRGRSAYPPAGQAAEVAIRRAHGLDRLDDVRLTAVTGEAWVFALASGGTATARVREEKGPAVVKSCGAEREPTTAFRVALGSA